MATERVFGIDGRINPRAFIVDEPRHTYGGEPSCKDRKERRTAHTRSIRDDAGIMLGSTMHCEERGLR
jgi:hypothetical protein